MIRFEEQFHCETKKKGRSALFAEKQRRNSLQSPPQEVYEVKIFCLEHLETKTCVLAAWSQSWQSPELCDQERKSAAWNQLHSCLRLLHLTGHT